VSLTVTSAHSLTSRNLQLQRDTSPPVAVELVKSAGDFASPHKHDPPVLNPPGYRTLALPPPFMDNKLMSLRLWEGCLKYAISAIKVSPVQGWNHDHPTKRLNLGDLDRHRRSANTCQAIKPCQVLLGRSLRFIRSGAERRENLSDPRHGSSCAHHAEIEPSHLLMLAEMSLSNGQYQRAQKKYQKHRHSISQGFIL
jgi:hypothetical protein